MRTKAPTDSSGEPVSRVVAATGQDARQSRPWTDLSSFIGDLDGDGAEEALTLWTSADRNKSGEMVWDDGQNFLLQVADGSQYYPLLDEYVQLGSVYFTVAQVTESGPYTVTIIVNTGSGLRLTTASYSQSDKGYRATRVYESGAVNLVHTSLQGYR